jgi:RNA polymerase sigma-70 factor (ECF subfamily)
MDSPDERRLLESALAGDREALGSLLERHRPYLVILASRELDPLVSARLSASDVAQQTYLEAVRGFGDFRGKSPREFMAWLKQILANNLVEATRVHLQAQKRSIRKEYKPAGSAHGRAGLPHAIASTESSPSSRAMRGERAVQLANVMQTLPDDQFEAIRLRYIEGWAVARIAGRMERSDSAVAGLLKRGLQGLRNGYSLLEEGPRD